MAAVEKAAPPPVPPRANAGMAPNPMRQSRITRQPRQICTHTTINRVRGGVTCSMCGRVPDHGWVYQCRQDYQPRKDDPLLNVDCMPTVPDECDYFDAKSRVAEYLRMSLSVVKGIRAGAYDLDQIDKLLSQREKVIRIVKEQEGGSKENTPTPSFDGVIASAGTTTYADCRTSISMSRRDSLAVHPTIVEPKKCRYAVCGGCRPYVQDRMWTSLESSWDDQLPLTDADMNELHMMNPIISRTIGLRSSPKTPLRSMPSHISIDITDGTDIESDSEISVNWSSTNSGESHSDGSESLEKPELFSCPGSHHCPVWSGRSECTYENGGLDDGKRAENHGFLNSVTPENSRSQLSHYTDLASSTPGASSTTASSVSRPATPMYPLLPLLHNEETFDVSLQKQIRESSENRDVEMPGGRRRETELGLPTSESKNSIISDTEGDGEVDIVPTY